MLKIFLIKWGLNPWKLNIIFSLTALAACIPILFPMSEQADTQMLIRNIFGCIILLSILAAIVQLAFSTVYFFLKMRNLRAIWQIMACVMIWGIACMLFSQLAIEADIPSPYPQEIKLSTEKEDTVHETDAHLKGPSTLCSYLTISSDAPPAKTLQAAPNLLKLEQEHADIFAEYLSRAPKWAATASDDTFYSKPGHVVMVVPTGGGIPGTVHVAFRTVSAGEQQPDGYLVIAPGEPLPPQAEEDKEEIPDLALDLGGKRYLLLAWRGVNNRETAYAAINAAIQELDSQFTPLAESPTAQTIQKLIMGQESIKGNTPELLLAEPSSQFGIYQAEIYANPGRAGTLMLVIRDKETQEPLLLFSHAAQYSTDRDTLYRHDIPLPLHDREGNRRMGKHADIFPASAPFFVIKPGESHLYFEITAEVHFSPAGSAGDQTELLLRRHYNVQAYEENEEEAPITPTDIFPEQGALPKQE
ncbi:MAG: hypothetical protein IKC90_00995 [Akkermansia sp.]|nr:hypothetical protein [Akkermansia sp.]